MNTIRIAKRIIAAAVISSSAFICAQDDAAQDDRESAPKDGAKDALAGLSYEGVPGADLKSYEKRRLYREIMKRLDEHAEAIAALTDRLAEAGYENVESLLTDKFDLKKLIPATPRKVETETAPARSSRGRKSGDKEKTSLEMPIVANGETFNAKEGILVVKTATGSATAFVADIKGKYFIVTNMHVITGGDMTFSTVNGVTFSAPSTGFVADGRDLFIMPLDSLPEGVKALPVSENIVRDVKYDDEVIVCGNAQGGGVLVVSDGKVEAIGPEAIETNCAIFQGNSGSPIYHKASKSIVGVISHASVVDDNLTKRTRQMDNSPIKRDTRYFGMRLDSVKTWTPLTPNEAASQFSDIETYVNKVNCAIAFRGHGRRTIVTYNYPEFERIVDKYRNQGKMGNVLDRKVEKEMYGDIARLLGNEAAKVKNRKYSDAFKSYTDALIEAFSNLRDYYTNLARR